MNRISQKNLLSSTALTCVLVVASLSVVACDGNSNGADPRPVPPVTVGPPPSPPPVPPSPPSPPPEPPSPPSPPPEPPSPPSPPPEPPSPPSPPPEPPSPPSPPPEPPGPPTPSPPPNPPPPSPSGWVQGTFRPMSEFEDRCVFPRTGQDPDNSRTYPDVAGKMLDEMFFLRSFTNKTYLWNNEVVDEDPIKYNKTKTNFTQHYENMVAYFNTQKTTENSTTNPNRAKDQFHFTQTTEEYINASNATPDPSYGIEWYSPKNNFSTCCWATKLPRDIRVGYIIHGSPAAKLTGNKLKRGDKLRKVNDEDMLLGGLTPQSRYNLLAPLLLAEVGTTTKFEFEDVDTGKYKTITIQAAEVVEKPVNNTNVITADDGKKVGYINFTTFNTYSSEKAINDAIGNMKTANVEDLVLDLRYNGGGFLWVAAQVGHMISGIRWPTAGNPQPNFAKFKFNNDAGDKDPRDGERNDPVPFVDFCLGGKFSIENCTGATLLDRPKLNSLGLKRVYILSSSRTCSASEAVINALRGADVEVILIGDRTCGKPYGFVPENNCGITYYTIQFQIRNNKDFGEYWDGLMPKNANYSHGVKVKGCYVEDDYKKELGDKEETLLAAALKYRKDQTCPALPPPPSPPPTTGIANAGNLLAGSDAGSTVNAGFGTSFEFPAERWTDDNLDLTVPSEVQEYLDDINEGK